MKAWCFPPCQWCFEIFVHWCLVPLTSSTLGNTSMAVGNNRECITVNQSSHLHGNIMLFLCHVTVWNWCSDYHWSMCFTTYHWLVIVQLKWYKAPSCGYLTQHGSHSMSGLSHLLFNSELACHCQLVDEQSLYNWLQIKAWHIFRSTHPFPSSQVE